MANQNKVPNHLKNETSPYLKQHVYNPVDWHPWGAEALEKAKTENKLIFLSIGYSTCHWCHVMAHESFEDETVATLLNDNYICIKVDREERPDIDSIYMNACQMMTGSGGWPLNLWLTPDQKPIYAGTYFPPHNQMGRPGFISVLTHLRKLWKEESEDLIGKSEEIMTFISGQSQGRPEEIDKFVTIQAVRDLKARFDPEYGGFSEAPKFPSAHQLLLLMHYYEQHPEAHLLEMIEKTLDSMYAGGIYDHVGGGFARYSVDHKWLVPHFEKMLYDNALLLRAYNQGYRLTQNPVYKEVAYNIVAFLKREMRSDEGGFFTALDADSEGVEGKFYVFTREEIDQALGDESEAYCEAYDITDKGNFEGLNIPNRIGRQSSIEVIDHFKASNQLLLDYRSKRIRPSLDYKILTSMNGLMISSLSHMFRVYGDQEILDLAIKANDYIERHHSTQEGLRGSSAKGIVNETVVLEDYAFYIEGLIDLYEATMNQQYLDKAIELLSVLDKEYWDNEKGGYFQTSSNGEQLISRPIDAYDGAVPSGNSVMAMNLLRLSRLMDKIDLQNQYDLLIKRFAGSIKKGPSYFTYMLMSLMYRQEGTKDLVVAADALTQSLMASIRERSLEYFTYDIRVGKGDKTTVDGKTTYYVCKNFACNQPSFEL